MTGAPPIPARSKWRWRVLLAAIPAIAVAVFVYRVRSTDIESAVEQAGGRIFWGMRPTGIEKFITLIPGVPDPTNVEVWLGDTDVDDEWLRRHRSGLSGLSDNVELALPRTRITDSGLRHLQDADNITNMWLSETAITDGGLDALCGCPNLGTLSIDRTQVTENGLAKLTDFPRLSYLGLDSSQFSDVGTAHLSNCPGLRWMTLREADDASVARLAQFPALEMIYLDGSGVTDASLPTISSLQKLQILSLLDCEISEAGFESLKQALPGCRMTRLTSEELEEMRSASHD